MEGKGDSRGGEDSGGGREEERAGEGRTVEVKGKRGWKVAGGSG